MSVVVKNPYTEEELGQLKFASAAEAQDTLARARQVFLKWRTSSAFQRSEVLRQAAQRLQAEKQTFVALLQQEVGKPSLYARAEVDRAIGVLNWASAEALRFSGELLRLDTSAGGRAGFGRLGGRRLRRLLRLSWAATPGFWCLKTPLTGSSP